MWQNVALHGNIPYILCYLEYSLIIVRRKCELYSSCVSICFIAAFLKNDLIIKLEPEIKA